MNMRLSVLIGVCAVLGTMMLSLAIGQPADAQAEIAPPPGGRYQIVVTQHNGYNTIVVFEPSTGQCWHRGIGVGQKWTDLGSPTIRVKE